MLSVPVLVPAVPGLKVTEIVQFAPASKLVPQVLVWVKSPLVVMLETGTGVSPGLLSATVCGLPAGMAEMLLRPRSEEELLQIGQ